MSLDLFEQWLKGATFMRSDGSTALDDDKKLYALANRYNIQPPFLIRILYGLWLRDRSPVSILDHAEKR